MVNKNISIEHADIGFRNFSGKPGKFTPAGRRSFCVFLDPDLAHMLEAEGWNIRWLTPRNEEDEPRAYLQVAVAYENFAPKVYLVTRKGKQLLDEKTVNVVDYAEIENVDLTIRPYNWEVSGKSGVKAYLKTMYVTLSEDEFEDKYYDVPDSAKSSFDEDA